MMFHTDLPEPFSRLVILQLEADGRLKVLEFAGPDLDVESVPLVRNLDDLGPRKPGQKKPRIKQNLFSNRWSRI